MKKLYFFLSALCLILTNLASAQVSTWMHGDVVGNQFGVYGTQGVPDAGNKPGGRQGAVSFTDAGNNFWLFGGNGLSALDDGQLNDLWKYSSITNQWTWVNGGMGSKSTGVYGTKGVAAPSNTPGARQDAISWVDASGFLWLMGGYGYSSTGLGYLNDLWKYNPTTNQWTWVSGDNIHNQNGIYSGLSKPGSRYGSVSWSDGSGNLWLMGGNGYASVGIGFLNDLWKYNTVLNTWTWVSGSNVPNQPAVYGTQGVAAPTNVPGSRSDAVSWFANNYLWLMGGDGYTETAAGVLNDLWKFDPLTSQWTWVSGDNTPNMLGVYGTKGIGSGSNKPGSRRNAVSWKVMYGALWLMGGEGFAAGAPGWMNDLWKFDLTTNLWTWMHGDDVPYQYGVYGTREVPSSSNVIGSRYDCAGWCDASNNLWLLAGKGNDVTTGGLLNDLWRISQLPATTNNLYYRDNDNDGYGDPSNSVLVIGTPQPGYVSNNRDCNDNNAAVHPGAPEICNGIDDNCNGQIDEGGGSITYYRDADADGYGDADVTSQACTQPTGYVTNNTDCNDNNPAANPAATEICNGIDDNCNGQIDEGCGTGTTYFRDADSDGYGDPNSTVQATTPPAGYVTNNTDCDDTKASVHPGATEVCNGIDDNCDGQIDEGVKSTFYIDTDGDGYGNPAVSTQACSAPAGYVTNNTDCDDAKAGVHPGAAELCNGIDDNCDGQIDEGCTIATTYYRDADGDSFGDPGVTVQATTPPPGYVTNNTDCDDTKATVYPGAPEVCNGIDDNCNGQIDEGVKTTFYRDADGDGYGTAANSTEACTAPTGYVSNNTDCDDAKSSVNPGATEICNGIDDNCNGQIDEGVKTTFYRDADGDGYGTAANSTQACSAPAGYVTNNTDCDDTKAAVHPGAAEICNGIDDNCNGQIDEGAASITFYRDADADGYGNPNLSTQACTAPAGYVTNNGDCNDANANIHPGAAEVCNGVDDDCDGQVDEGVKRTFYRDADHDGYGNPAVTIQACMVAPAGYVSNNTDCDDTRAAVHPGASEICNGLDDDCDGLIDEGLNSTFYRDADGDGYGTSASTTQACTAPAGYVSNNTDCNDANASVYPGALEVCNNNIDDNCNGQIDEGCNTTSNQICAFDEDFYGSLNTTCVFGTQVNSRQMMVSAVDAQPNDSVSFGSKPNKKYFTLRLADVQNNNIFNMLPGQGKSKSLKGYATYSKSATWKNVPLKSNGTIDNELLSQTMTLFFNMYISPTLKNISLDKKLVIRKLYFCSVPGPQENVSFHIKKSIIKCLKNQYGDNGATVNNLYVLANDILGDIKSKEKDCKVKKKDLMKALENINEMFGRCVQYFGYGPRDDGDDDDDSPDDDDDDDDHHGDHDHDRIIGNSIFQQIPFISGKNSGQVLLVAATPNPFHDRIQFTITSPVSGDARIQIFDVNGKLVGEIKQKVFSKATNTVNYITTRKRQGMLFYKITVNNFSATGKLVQMD